MENRLSGALKLTRMLGITYSMNYFEVNRSSDHTCEYERHSVTIAHVLYTEDFDSIYKASPAAPYDDL